MQIKILDKAITISGRFYQPGEIAEVSQSTARVLRATRRAVDYVPRGAKNKPINSAPVNSEAAPTATQGDDDGSVKATGTKQYNRRDITP